MEPSPEAGSARGSGTPSQTANARQHGLLRTELVSPCFSSGIVSPFQAYCWGHMGFPGRP